MPALLNEPSDLAFRETIRRFVADTLPDPVRQKVRHGAPATRDEILHWHKALHAKGWVAPAWPEEHGGPGWTPRQRMIFDEEMFRLNAPPLPGFGLKMIGPVLIAFGNQAQRERFLPRILSGEDWWCQGFSEPGAGSDLASLACAARRVDGGWIVDGSKTWTTYAQHANWIFCLVRTDPAVKKQEGISMMLIDMADAGVSVHPIKLMDGTKEVNTVFFDTVFVPDDRVVGEINKGWTYAKFLLENERLGIGGIGRSKHALDRARALAETVGLGHDRATRETLARIEVDILALEATTLRFMARERAGQRIGPEASLLKIRGTEIQQRLTEVMLGLAGPAGLGDFAADDERAEAGNADHPIDPAFRYVGYQHLNWRKLSIYGGSNQIQRAILATQVLRL